MAGFKGVKIAIILTAVAGLICFLPVFASANECASCHTDADKLKELTKGASIERVFVGEAFFNDENHGETTCDECHQGDPDNADFATAHEDVIVDPSYPAPGVCADCHDNDNYEKSVHYKGLADVKDEKKNFHASCGQCHLSKPGSAGGGLVKGHAFLKVPSMDENCNACHIATGVEYKGRGTQPADAHYAESEMNCSECHTAEQMHGDAPASAAACITCHEDIYDKNAEYKNYHATHKDRVSCHVCHAEAYIGGGVGEEIGEEPVYYFKAALNPNITDEKPDKFITVRKVGENWQPYTPHTIQRKTTQAADCNACHGYAENRNLYLLRSDVKAEYRHANRPMVVPPSRIPARIAGD